MTSADPARVASDPADSGAAMTAIARGGVASLLGSGVSAASQLVVVVVVTRWYSPSDAGALFAATAVFLIAVAVVQLGTDQGLVRFVAGHRARGEHHELRRILRIGLLPVLGTSVLGGLVMYALAAPLADLFDSDGADGVAGMLRILAIAVPFAAMHEAFLAGSRGLGSMRSTVVVERIIRPLLQPLTIVAVALAGFGVPALAPAWAAPYAVAVIGSAIALRRTLREVEIEAGQPEAVASPDPTLRSNEAGRSLRAEFWSYTAGRAVARIFQVALQRVDVILVAATIGTAAVAVYAAATRFIAVGMLANQAIQQVIQPRLAAMFAKGNYDAAQVILRRTTVWLVALVWPGYLVLAAMAPSFMELFGQEYRAGWPSLAILAGAMMLASAAGPLDVALLMAGRSAVSLLNMTVALAVDVVGCLLLLRPLGVTGAAIAWAAAIVVRNLMTVEQTRRMLGIGATSRELAVVCLLALGAFAVPPAALTLTGAPTVAVACAVALGAVAYALALLQRRAQLGLSRL